MWGRAARWALIEARRKNIDAAFKKPGFQPNNAYKRECKYAMTTIYRYVCENKQSIATKLNPTNPDGKRLSAVGIRSALYSMESIYKR